MVCADLSDNVLTADVLQIEKARSSEVKTPRDWCNLDQGTLLGRRQRAWWRR